VWRRRLKFCFSPHLFQNRLAYQPGEGPYQAPVDAELPQRCPPEALDSCLSGKNRGRCLWQCCPQPKIPRHLGVSGTRKVDEVSRREIHAAPAIRTPESSRNPNHKLVVRNLLEDNEARALESLTQVAGPTMARHSSSGSKGHQEARQPEFTEVRVQKRFIHDRAWSVDEDLIGRAEIVIRQECVNSRARFGYATHAFFADAVTWRKTSINAVVAQESVRSRR
jgi:hypothetical protein